MIGSNDLMGMASMRMGSFLKSFHTNTRSKFFSPNWMRSMHAISTSLRLTTMGGLSSSATSECTVGMICTCCLAGTPVNPSSL